MAKITLEVPDDVAEMFKALEARLKSLEADRTGAAPAVKESEVDVVTSGIALELKRRGLQALEIDTEYVTSTGSGTSASSKPKRRTTRKKERSE